MVKWGGGGGKSKVGGRESGWGRESGGKHFE